MSFTPFPFPHVLHASAHFILFDSLFNTQIPGEKKENWTFSVTTASQSGLQKV